MRVLSKGPLARAMRATMAIPGVFTPVNYDDGSWWTAARSTTFPRMSPARWAPGTSIAVNVGADAVNEKEAESLFALLGRTIDTMMATGTRRALKSADVIIDPDLKGLGSTDWRRSDDLAQRGYAAAEAMADKLTPLALGPGGYERFQAARAARRRTSAPMVQFVNLVGLPPPLSPRVEATIARAFQNQVGATLDPETMRTDILTATGSDRFEFLTYTGTEKDGKTGALIGVRPKSYGPPFLALGLELSNRDSSSFAVSLAGRITAYDLVGPGSELRADLGVGTRQVAAVELFRPIGGKGFFAAPRAYFERTGRNAYLDDDFVAEYRVKRSGIGGDVGYTTNERLEIRAGYDVATVQVRRHIGNPVLPEGEGGEKASRLLVTFDGQTSPIVPSRGLFMRGLLRHFDDTPDIVSGGPRTAGAAQPRTLHAGRGGWQLVSSRPRRRPLLRRRRGRDLVRRDDRDEQLPAGGTAPPGRVQRRPDRGVELRQPGHRVSQAGRAHARRHRRQHLRRLLAGDRLCMGQVAREGLAEQRHCRGDSRVAAGPDFLRGQLQQQPRAVLRRGWAALPVGPWVYGSMGP